MRVLLTLLTPAQIKQNKIIIKNRLTADGTISLHGADASHVYTFSESADSVGRRVARR